MCAMPEDGGLLFSARGDVLGVLKAGSYSLAARVFN